MAAVLFLWVLQPSFAQSPKEGDHYSNDAFFINFEKGDTLSFALPKLSGLGTVTVAGRGRYTINRKKNCITVQLLLGYIPTRNYNEIYKVSGERSDGYTEFIFDSTSAALFPNISYFDKRKRPHYFKIDSTGRLVVEIKSSVYGGIVDITAADADELVLPAEQIVGKSIYISLAKSSPKTLSYSSIIAPPLIYHISFILQRDSMSVNFVNKEPIVLLVKNAN
ncbi:hypothetical protein GCM10023092_17840 [Rurimicrobium arvi]|uniref:DUF3108 domain-containing protein n=2 Tax=Rurimicrobium arvi TaxID=2049916 RepID=A0ABP8MU03_9BACT